MAPSGAPDELKADLPDVVVNLSPHDDSASTYLLPPSPQYDS